MREIGRGRLKVVHPYAWLWEPLEAHVSFVLRSMFGAKAAYLDGKLMLCFIAQGEPWHGVLVATERAHQPSLVAEFPALAPHPVLPKWLYLSDAADGFERIAERLVALAARRDPRIGVIPKPRKPRRAPRPSRRSRR